MVFLAVNGFFWGERYHAPNFLSVYPPVSEENREVANLTERKNPHTPLIIVYLPF